MGSRPLQCDFLPANLGGSLIDMSPIVKAGIDHSMYSLRSAQYDSVHAVYKGTQHYLLPCVDHMIDSLVS